MGNKKEVSVFVLLPNTFWIFSFRYLNGLCILGECWGGSVVIMYRHKHTCRGTLCRWQIIVADSSLAGQVSDLMLRLLYAFTHFMLKIITVLHWAKWGQERGSYYCTSYTAGQWQTITDLNKIQLLIHISYGSFRGASHVIGLAMWTLG